MCSHEAKEGSFCVNCGYPLPQSTPSYQTAYYQNGPQPSAYYPAYYPQPNWDQSGPAKNWAIASVALGVASFIVLPIIFTPLGVAFGAVSLTKRGQKNWLAILGIVLSLLGMMASIAVAALLP